MIKRVRLLLALGFLGTAVLIGGFIYLKLNGVTDQVVDGPGVSSQPVLAKAMVPHGNTEEFKLSRQSLRSTSASDPLATLKSIDEGTSADVAYEHFNLLKNWLGRGPSQIDQAVSLLSHPGSGSAADKRQRSLVYGALAETNSPEAASGLIKLASAAKSEDDVIQSVSAIADQRSPTQAALPTLWHAYEANSGASKHMSLLAFGSAAYHLERAGESPGDAADKLIAAYGAMPSEEGRIEILVAMGNHGSVRYFEVLKAAVRDQSDWVRRAAVYALRFHEGVEAGALLAEIATQDSDEKIKAEAIAALAMQLDQRRDFARVAKVALSSRDSSVQLSAAVILTGARARAASPEVDQAIAALRTGSSMGEVQAYLGG